VTQQQNPSGASPQTQDSHGTLATTPLTGDPIADPGLHEHQPRPTDVDDHAEKRAERQIATFFGLSSVFSILFVVAYFAFPVGEDPKVILGYGASNVALGLTLGLALLCIGLGAIQWARKLMSDVEIVEMRHTAKSSDADREEAVAAFHQGVSDSGIGRRPMVRNSLLGALGIVLLPAVVVLRDLGPLPGDKLAHTV
jgi:ubiquinol-cytochrome c reductase iron-sulfur subunit